MVVRIGSNISSLKAQRQLGRASEALSTTSERLASGQRINKASDDAAGLAVSSSLNIASRVFGVAVRNVSDTISAVSIASGALDALTQVTQRQLELASQASNGVYSAKQREALNAESKALTNEYNRIIDTTSFNGLKLLKILGIHLLPNLGSAMLQLLDISLLMTFLLS